MNSDSPYHETTLNNKNEPWAKMHNNLNESQRHSFQMKEDRLIFYVLYDSIYHAFIGKNKINTM